MAVLDMDDPVDRVRLMVADISDLPILPDNVYESVLAKNSNNEVASAKEIAYYILGLLSQGTKERLDRLEFDGSAKFNQYLKFIQEFIKSPTSQLNLATMYTAGVFTSDVAANCADATVVHKVVPKYSTLDALSSAAFYEGI